MKVKITEARKNNNKDLSRHIMAPRFDDEKLQEAADIWHHENNYAAAIQIILHNQKIISDKLNKLIKQNGKRKLQKSVPMRRLPRGKGKRNKKSKR